jgi:hypothetical protein
LVQRFLFLNAAWLCSLTKGDWSIEPEAVWIKNNLGCGVAALLLLEVLLWWNYQFPHILGAVTCVFFLNSYFDLRLTALNYTGSSPVRAFVQQLPPVRALTKRIRKLQRRHKK